MVAAIKEAIEGRVPSS